MNRNVEEHFAELPSVDIQRSIFDRSFTHKTSFNVGDLIPFFVDEVLPGDTFKVTTSKVVRLQTLLTPVMDNLYLDTYYFFVPNRLVWSHWKEFNGENTQSAWYPSTTYQIPSISSPVSTGFASGTIADYMGLPVGVVWDNQASRRPSALPFRAYAMICDQFFRDENLTDPLNIPTGDSNQTGTNGGNYVNDVANGGKPFKVAKYHDYFTSCLPAPQKGPAVTLPVVNADLAPVSARYDKDQLDVGDDRPDNYAKAVHVGFFDANDKYAQLSASANIGARYISSSNPNVLAAFTGTNLPGTYVNGLVFNNLYADLSSTIGAVSINELRLAFQLQKYYERNARGGLISVFSGLRVNKIEEKIWKAA